MLDDIFELEGKCIQNSNSKNAEEFVKLIREVKGIIIEMNKKLPGNSRQLIKK